MSSPHRFSIWFAALVLLGGCGEPLPQGVLVELLPKVSVTVETPQVEEGKPAKFIIQLSEPVAEPVEVRYYTAPGSASSNDDPPDYDGQDTPFSPTPVRLNPGEIEYPVEINTTDDTVREADETFTLNLHSATGAEVNLDRYIATVTILDNDDPDILELGDDVPPTKTLLENAGTFFLSFKLYNPDAPDAPFSPGLDITLPIQYAGTAIPGEDFQGPAEVVLKKNENLNDFRVPIVIIDDVTSDEPDKTIEITLGTPDEAVLGDRIQTTLTLIDDDGSGRLNDTGVTRCQDDTSEGPCPQDSHPGQDGDQDTPMRFSLYAVDGDECIVDETTGLMWERKQPNNGGIRQSGAIYTWYNTVDNTNGGDPGTNSASGAGFGVACRLDNCTTTAYVEALNQAGVCGFNDWRLPKLHELLSLVHYAPDCESTDNNGDCTHWYPTIDRTAFPLTIAGAYWTASPSAYRPGYAWMVDFTDGTFTTQRKAEWGYLRAVRRIRPGDLPP